MSRIFPISRWLVVDDSPDDTEDIVLAIEGLGGKVDTADSMKAAEKLLKKNIYDVCIVDCFYKGSTKWGVDILPEIRNTLPGLPVVMISSSDELELPGKVIRAGADVFCPKLRDSFSLTKVLGAAALQAIAVRRLKMTEYQSGSSAELFILKHTADLLEHSIRRKEERLLICGASGTGKTKIAKYFANQFLKQNFGSISRNIVYHSCSTKSDESNAQLLFGTEYVSGQQSHSSLQLTLFERAIGGVLILDDIHVLSEENQLKLKHVFDEELIPSNIAEGKLPLSLVKCVATFSTNGDLKLVPGLLEAYAHREIDLPSIADLGAELSHAIRFLMDQFFSANTDSKLVYNQDVVDRILDLANEHSFPANFRTLNQIIENAFSHALSERRSQIYLTDIELIGRLKSTSAVAAERTQKRVSSVFDNRLGENLLRLVSQGENFDEAKDILRRMMIGVASKKYSGNKSRIAASLGISRQSLYDHEEHE